MKKQKIWATLLSSALIISAFSMNSFAARIVGNSDGVITDGVSVDDFDSESSAADITLNITEGVQNRYAVDIEYGTLEFTFDMGLVWDVNEHKYVAQDGGTDNTPKDISTEIKIYNHSDLPVYQNFIVTAINGCTLTKGLSTEEKKIDMTRPNANDEEVSSLSTPVQFSVKPANSGTWSDVINNHSTTDGDSVKLVVATIIVTISKDSTLPGA